MQKISSFAEKTMTNVAACIDNAIAKGGWTYRGKDQPVKHELPLPPLTLQIIKPKVTENHLSIAFDECPSRLVVFGSV
jgi:hypothetical protein